MRTCRPPWLLSGPLRGVDTLNLFLPAHFPEQDVKSPAVFHDLLRGWHRGNTTTTKQITLFIKSTVFSSFRLDEDLVSFLLCAMTVKLSAEACNLTRDPMANLLL